jgi:hypothetical protein
LDDVSKKIYSEVQMIEVQYANEYSKNISKLIKYKCDNNLSKCLSENSKTRDEVNEILKSFATNQFKYVYVVIQDKDGKFRYLFDGSKDIKERGVFWQNFFPESNIWFEAYKKGISKWSVQTDVSGIWLTYLHPITASNKTQALIAMDISIQEFSRIIELVRPIKQLLIFLTAVLVIAIIITIYQTFMLYKAKKKSIIDPLTGLFNRNFLNDMKNKLKLRDFSIALVDIDYFKKINDTYAHDCGYKVLV